ncbi:hypothetical protein RI065_05665 [Mycoplasmatota bacterium zrk1]
MANYDVDFKITVVKFFKENGLSETKRKFNVSQVAVYKWETQFDGEGFTRKKRKVYTFDEKMEMLNSYWKYGIIETERKFNIGRSSIHKWELIYNEEGEHGLTKSKRSKVKKNLTENEQLMEELQYLRMENAALKKLGTLVRNRKK